MRRSIDELTASLRRTASIVSMIVAGAGGIFAFIGYRDLMAESGQDELIAKGMAAIAALATAAIMHLIYSAVLSAIPAVDGATRRKLNPIVAVLMAMVALFATYTTVIATAGGEALRIHAAHSIDALLDTGTRLQAAALSIGQQAPALQRQADALKRAAECEAASGCRSGTGGSGDLTDALHAAGGKIETAAVSLADASAAIATLTPALNDAFARGDEIAARVLLAEIRAKVPFDVIVGIAGDLRADLGIRGTAHDTALRARQDAAIAQLQKDLAGIAGRLEIAMTRLRGELDALTVPKRETITKAKAIWRYADQLIPQIALGIAIDWALVIVAYFIAIIRDGTPKRDDDLSDISIEDARRIHWALVKLQAETAKPRFENEPGVARYGRFSGGGYDPRH